jgi:hypothetical protein
MVSVVGISTSRQPKTPTLSMIQTATWIPPLAPFASGSDPRQLAHIDGAGVRAADARGEHWDERVSMMQWWADYLDELRTTSSDSAPISKACPFGGGGPDTSERNLAKVGVEGSNPFARTTRSAAPFRRARGRAGARCDPAGWPRGWSTAAPQW